MQAWSRSGRVEALKLFLEFRCYLWFSHGLATTSLFENLDVTVAGGVVRFVKEEMKSTGEFQVMKGPKFF